MGQTGQGWERRLVLWLRTPNRCYLSHFFGHLGERGCHLAIGLFVGGLPALDGTENVLYLFGAFSHSEFWFSLDFSKIMFPGCSLCWLCGSLPCFPLYCRKLATLREQLVKWWPLGLFLADSSLLGKDSPPTPTMYKYRPGYSSSSTSAAMPHSSSAKVLSSVRHRS